MEAVRSAAAAAAVAVALGAGPALAGGPQVTDLGETVARYTREYPERTDALLPLHAGSGGSIHLHVLGFGQLLPLHVQPRSEVVEVVVSGAPRLSAAYGEEGAVRSERIEAPPGLTLVAPPLTGLEWGNPSRDAMAGILVLASPPFAGYLHLHEGDGRLLEGRRPLVLDHEAALGALAASGEPFRTEPLPVQGERAAAVYVQGVAEIPPHPRSPTFLYVARGEGSLLLGEGVPLRERLLVEVPPRTRLRIVAAPAAPLVLVAFRPGD